MADFSGFEAAARPAILDNIEERCRNEIGPELRDRIVELLEEYRGYL